jgi:hypothetical protein
VQARSENEPEEENAASCQSKRITGGDDELGFTAGDLLDVSNAPDEDEPQEVGKEEEKEEKEHGNHQVRYGSFFDQQIHLQARKREISSEREEDGLANCSEGSENLSVTATTTTTSSPGIGGGDAPSPAKSGGGGEGDDEREDDDAGSPSAVKVASESLFFFLLPSPPLPLLLRMLMKIQNRTAANRQSHRNSPWPMSSTRSSYFAGMRSKMAKEIPS